MGVMSTLNKQSVERFIQLKKKPGQGNVPHSLFKICAVYEKLMLNKCFIFRLTSTQKLKPLEISWWFLTSTRPGVAHAK